MAPSERQLSNAEPAVIPELDRQIVVHQDAEHKRGWVDWTAAQVWRGANAIGIGTSTNHTLADLQILRGEAVQANTVGDPAQISRLQERAAERIKADDKALQSEDKAISWGEMGAAGLGAIATLALGAVEARYRLNVLRNLHPELDLSRMGLGYSMKSQLGRILPWLKTEGSVAVPSYAPSRVFGHPKSTIWHLSADDPAAKLYEQVAPSVVRVRTSDGGWASGYAVSRHAGAETTDLVATEKHVVRVFDRNNKPAKLMADLSDGQSLPANIVGVNEETGAALIRVPGASLKPIPLGSARSVVDGERVLVFGHADGSKKVFMSDGPGTAWWFDQESGVHVKGMLPQGVSGGPGVNLRGEAVATMSTDIQISRRVRVANGSGAEHIADLLRKHLQ